ncbi:hypothetical protein BGX21_009421 [Mortierella sp. AD011]|nr:hypothetical protein BGX20_009771 [Mortierella sp. AD010]KAF9396713.1 hypothetical protein BGX21_009421 [Mortierella sp. AD011]
MFKFKLINRTQKTFTTSNELSKNLKRPVSDDLEASEEHSSKKVIRDGKCNSQNRMLRSTFARGQQSRIKILESNPPYFIESPRKMGSDQGARAFINAEPDEMEEASVDQYNISGINSKQGSKRNASAASWQFTQEATTSISISAPSKTRKQAAPRSIQKPSLSDQKSLPLMNTDIRASNYTRGDLNRGSDIEFLDDGSSLSEYEQSSGDDDVVVTRYGGRRGSKTSGQWSPSPPTPGILSSLRSRSSPTLQPVSDASSAGSSSQSLPLLPALESSPSSPRGDMHSLLPRTLKILPSLTRSSSQSQALNINPIPRRNSRPYMPTLPSAQSPLRTTSSSFPLFTLLQRPARPVITQDDKDWTEMVMKFDPKLNRFRYAISNPSEKLNDTSRRILEEAFKANQAQVDRLSEEDYEFFGVIAETTSNLARSYLKDLIKINAVGTNPSSPKKKHAHETVGVHNSPATNLKRSKESGVMKSATNDTAIKYINNATKSEVIVRKFIPSQHRVLQNRRCMAYKVADVEFCKPCICRQAQYTCQFHEFRYFYVKTMRDADNISKHVYGPDFYSNPRVDASFRFDKADLGKEESDYIIAYTHSLSQDLFHSESKHVLDALKNDHGDIDDDGVRRSDYVRRPSQDRQYCEICKASIVSGYWMCCVCAQDVCLDCFETLNEDSTCTRHRPHKKEQFVPCGRFHISTLTNSINSLNARVQDLPRHLIETAGSSAFKPSKALRTPKAKTEMEYRTPLKSSSESITLDEFRIGWHQGEAILLSGVGKRLEKDWSPKYLIATYGDVAVTALDIKTQHPQEMTLKEYFDNHFVGQPTDPARRMMEWPSEPFQDVFEDLFADLLNALPLPDYTKLRGVFNLVRYFPIGQIGVDLSPKLYPSQGLGPNCLDYGSIPISCELSDSIYICVYTNPPKGLESEEPSSQSSESISSTVVWDVYRAEDRHLVQSYIEQEMSKEKKRKITDPFTFRTHYLSPSDQEELYRKTGARPYRVLQNLGDAIMIPAGCVRQARYIHDAILVGLDFVSPERFGVTLQWQKELRAMNLRRRIKKSPDVLMAKDILFYSTLATL